MSRIISASPLQPWNTAPTHLLHARLCLSLYKHSWNYSRRIIPFFRQLSTEHRRAKGRRMGQDREKMPRLVSCHGRRAITHDTDGERPACAKQTAYVALGSNLGDRVAMIEQACSEMNSRGIKVKRTSNLWETLPMYVLDQGNFINGVCEVETCLSPIALLDELQSIEITMGRQKFIDKGPRNIDLDILLYGNETLETERLKIPHAGIPEREFVLRPLAELIPNKAIYPSKPWTLVQDYLNALSPPASSSPSAPQQPMSSLTPLRRGTEPLYPLKTDRKTHVMAILNVTPDSFSDGGIHKPETLRETILHLARTGTTIIDVGGQSTAPGAQQVSAQEELSRVVPTIQLIRSLQQQDDALSHMITSVDTYRASVAEAAVVAGADIVNDISGGLMDKEMLPTISRLGVTICLMHTRGTPQTMSSMNDYDPEGLIPTLAQELLQRVVAAEVAGIRRWRIILDPGIGFAKLGDQNVEILRHLEELRRWPGLRGFPWLIGASRKKFVGTITQVRKPQDRVWGTAAAVAAAIQGGVDVVRVHDAKEMVQVAKMADAIWRF